jgi:hypothetical protein
MFIGLAQGSLPKNRTLSVAPSGSILKFQASLEEIER